MILHYANINQSFFIYQAEGALVHIIRAYTASYLGGTPSQKTGNSPPSCLLLENRLYMFASITSLTFEVQNNHSRKAVRVSDVEMR